jgi:hypothetical protein
MKVHYRITTGARIWELRRDSNAGKLAIHQFFPIDASPSMFNEPEDDNVKTEHMIKMIMNN